MKLIVTLYCDKDGAWIVEYPAILRCVSQEHTREEALHHIHEAI